MWVVQPHGDTGVSDFGCAKINRKYMMGAFTGREEGIRCIHRLKDTLFLIITIKLFRFLFISFISEPLSILLLSTSVGFEVLEIIIVRTQLFVEGGKSPDWRFTSAYCALNLPYTSE